SLPSLLKIGKENESNTENHINGSIKYVFVNFYCDDIHNFSRKSKKNNHCYFGTANAEYLSARYLLGLSQNKEIPTPSEEKKRWIIASVCKPTKIFRLASAACWAWP